MAVPLPESRRFLHTTKVTLDVVFLPLGDLRYWNFHHCAVPVSFFCYREAPCRRKARLHYPLTCTLENDSTTRLAVGWPKAVAGWKVVKISMFFSCGKMSSAFSGADRIR